MKVSIVTISYNQARFLKRNIESVRQQDYPNIEHIIVDPGSTDGSREIIQQYKNHFSQIILEPDDGPADGLHKGIDLATGDILAQLNADDCYLPGAISKVTDEFTKYPELGVVYGNGIMADLDGMPIKHIYADEFSANGYVYGRVAIFQQATFYTQWAYQRVGGLNLNNQNSWDAELMVDFSMEDIPMRKIDHDLGVFSIYPQSISGSKRLIDMYHADQERIFEKVTGRPATSVDKFIRKCGKILRLGRNPAIIYKRLVNSLLGTEYGINTDALTWMNLKDNY